MALAPARVPFLVAGVVVVARILPAEPLPGTSPAEIKVLQALRRLPESWVVLHSVAWQSLRDGREGDGEADVVAINPRWVLL